MANKKSLIGHNTAKLWSVDMLTVGLAARGGDSELHGTNDVDCISLFSENYSVMGAFDSDKLKEVNFKRNDFSYHIKGSETYSYSDERGESYFVKFNTAVRDSLADELNPAFSLQESLTATSGLRNSDMHMRMIKDFLDSDGFGGRLRAEAILTLLLTDVFQTLDKQVNVPLGNTLNQSKLSLIEEYIDAHLDEKIGIEDLAELAGISSFHFAKLFKVATGLSPHQFVMQHRVKRAQQLLQNQSLSLAQVSFDVGFSSQSHMSDVFKKLIGVTPGRYRKDFS